MSSLHPCRTCLPQLAPQELLHPILLFNPPCCRPLADPLADPRRRRYPDVPVCLLSATLPLPVLMQAAQRCLMTRLLFYWRDVDRTELECAPPPFYQIFSTDSRKLRSRWLA